MIAEAFAQTLQCEAVNKKLEELAGETESERIENKFTAEPCMECHSCKQAAGKNQPDIIYVSHEKPNTISVDDIRTQLNNDIVIKPYSSKHKIYIVDEAEKMNQQGNVGKAIQLAASDDFNELKASALQLIKRLHDIDLYEMTEAVKQISEYKLQINDYFDLMMIWYRDVLYYKATKDVNGLIFKDEVYDIKRQAEQSSYNGIEEILQALSKAQVRLNANVNFDLVIELLLLTIKEN